MNIMRFETQGTHTSLRKTSSLASLAAATFLLAAPVMAQQTVSGTECMATRTQLDGGFALGCTANDIRVASAVILPDANGNTVACAYPGATVTFRAQFTVESTATERYDIGLWFAQDGDPNKDGALTGTCSVSTLPTGATSYGSFINLDSATQPGDTCGDIKKPGYNPLYPIVEMTATCVDYDKPGDPGYGKLDLPYCTSWRQSGSNELCSSPLQAYPGAPSKCKCDRTFDVPIDVPPASLRITKTPSPTSVPEPGADVTYTVVIYNDAIDPVNSVTISSLTDDIVNSSGAVTQSLGSLFQGETGTAIKSTTCAKPMVIAANGGSVSCQFTVRVAGNAGASVRDRVSTSGTDHYNNSLSGSAEATVPVTDLAPDITVVKSANITDVNEPGGNVTFTVTVTNTSPGGAQDPIRITTLVDDQYGNLGTISGTTCNSAANPYPTALAYGAAYSCSFTVYVAGDGKIKTSVTDVITATVTDNDGGTPYPENSNPVTVSIHPIGSSITVLKQVSLDGVTWRSAVTTDEVPAPGVNVYYQLTITNNSTVDIVYINSLTEKVKLNGGDFGSPYNLASNCSTPITLAANGGSRTCTFTLKLYGNAGDSHVNEITAAGVDDDNDPVSDSSSASVAFRDVRPTAVLTKDPDRAAVVYHVTVTNTSTAEPLYLTALVDDKFGNITRSKTTTPSNTQIESTSCALGTIAIGATYQCYFTAFVDQEDAPHVNTVTATISDDEGADVAPSPSDTATVDLK